MSIKIIKCKLKDTICFYPTNSQIIMGHYDGIEILEKAKYKCFISVSFVQVADGRDDSAAGEEEECHYPDWVAEMGPVFSFSLSSKSVVMRMIIMMMMMMMLISQL